MSLKYVLASTLLAAGLMATGCQQGDYSVPPRMGQILSEGSCEARDLKNDDDHDGVPGSSRNPCSFQEDWCPGVSGPKENHGCPILSEGATCPQGGLWSHKLVFNLEHAKTVYPQNYFCLYDPSSDFERIDDSSGGAFGWVSKSEKPGTWINPTTPLLALISALPNYRWMKQDGTWGSQHGLQPGFVGKQAQVLPTTGSPLVKIESFNPDATITLKYILNGSTIDVACTQKNAAGGPVCQL